MLENVSNFTQWLGMQPRLNARRRTKLLESLPLALRTGELFVVFQPMVELKTQRVFAYEALIRSTSAHFQGPVSLFDSAVDSECCGLLGRAVREMATEVCPDRPLFLNIHPRELEEEWLMHPEDPLFTHLHPVVLEITEAAPIDDLMSGRSKLAELRNKSVAIAIDDLGAGYSNLKSIADLCPDVVKLDRGLVANLAGDRRMQIVVTALVQLCDDLGARVVAEGVESEEEAAVLTDIGAHFAQGYYFGRPSRWVSAPAQA